MAEFDEIIARLDELCVYLLKTNPQTTEELTAILKRFVITFLETPT